MKPLEPRRRLRSRLLVAMAAIAIGVLVFTGITTIALARRGAVNAAENDLRDRAPEIATQVENLARLLRRRQTQTQAERVPLLRQLIASTLRISGAGVVTITPEGDLQAGVPGIAAITGGGGDVSADTALPPGPALDDLDASSLEAGHEQTGRAGRYVWIAQPLESVQTGTPVLVLSQQIETNPAGRAGGFFLLMGAIAIGAAVIVAFFLARRLTRPLATMGETAGRIAGGDLSARVDLGKHPDDELAALASALNGMASELEHTRGVERAFILSVSHDLRTPLTSIRGYAEALTDGTLGEDAEGRQRAAQVIGSEARRLERLVNDLLTLARLDARQFSLTPQPIDARSAITTGVDGFRPAADELGITLRVDAPSALPADADPERLGQIVANLVENALKYAQSTISVVLVPYGTGELDVRVQDDGPGIASEDLPQVFDRLYTSRTVTGRSVGTGLGLAIVRELAVAMGGTAWVDAGTAAEAPVRGATFVVRLPILRTAPVGASPSEPAARNPQ